MIVPVYNRSNATDIERLLALGLSAERALLYRGLVDIDRVEALVLARGYDLGTALDLARY